MTPPPRQDDHPRLAQVCCEFWFESSHRLFRPDWTDEQNAAVFGKCVRLHGHSYHLKVSFRGPIQPDSGMVVNFFDVKREVRERVVDRLDHYHLNDVVPGIPTAENTAYWIAQQLTGRFDGVELSRVELWETRTSYAFLSEADLEAIRGRGAGIGNPSIA
jgi:6-pyruvoyltetrahydropterin/6-carboxytetrahydropterin synthase